MAQTGINPEEILAQLTPQDGMTEAQQAYAASLGEVPEIVSPEYQAVPEVAVPEREGYQRQRYGSRWATFLSRLAHARAGMQDPTISWEQRQNELAKLHAAEQNEIINRALQQQQAERLRRQELNRQAEQQAGLKTAQSAQGVEARQKRTGAEVEFEQGARQQKIDYVKTAAALEKTRKGEFNADTYKQLATSYDTLLQDPEVVQAADDLMRIENGTADVEVIRRAGAGGFKYQQARDLLTLQQALQQMIPSVMQQQASAVAGVQPSVPQPQQAQQTQQVPQQQVSPGEIALRRRMEGIGASEFAHLSTDPYAVRLIGESLARGELDPRMADDDIRAYFSWVELVAQVQREREQGARESALRRAYTRPAVPADAGERIAPIQQLLSAADQRRLAAEQAAQRQAETMRGDTPEAALLRGYLR